MLQMLLFEQLHVIGKNDLALNFVSYLFLVLLCFAFKVCNPEPLFDPFALPLC